MKKIMTMVAAIMMVATANASNKSVESSIMDTRRVAPFSEVNVNVPARVRVIQGDEYGVQASSYAAFDTTKLEYEVKNGVLYIHTNCSEMLSASGRGTVITITTPTNLTSVKLGDDVQEARKKK